MFSRNMTSDVSFQSRPGEEGRIGRHGGRGSQGRRQVLGRQWGGSGPTGTQGKLSFSKPVWVCLRWTFWLKYLVPTLYSDHHLGWFFIYYNSLFSQVFERQIQVTNVWHWMSTFIHDVQKNPSLNSCEMVNVHDLYIAVHVGWILYVIKM